MIKKLKHLTIKARSRWHLSLTSQEKRIMIGRKYIYIIPRDNLIPYEIIRSRHYRKIEKKSGLKGVHLHHSYSTFYWKFYPMKKREKEIKGIQIRKQEIKQHGYLCRKSHSIYKNIPEIQ